MAATILIDDLETYIGQYGPHGAIQRLQFIVSTSTQKNLRVDACKLCLDMLKRTTNSKGYTDMYNSLKELLEGEETPLPHFDSVWVEATQKQATILKDLHEQDLHQAKVTQIKEQIRTSHTQLTNLCMDQGDYASALKHVAKSREYCIEPQAIFSTCMTIIKLNALLRQYTDIQSFASKAHHTPSKDEGGASKVSAAFGLFYMATGKYADAANAFVQVKHQDLGQAFADVISPQDVALYAVLCALAALERNEIQTKLLDSSTFQECLDLVPSIRDIATDFCTCKYAASLSALEKMKDALTLDVHLHSQVADLCQQIRSKAIVQYFSPFLTVSLYTMAEAFNTDVDGIQSEVAKLIGGGRLNAKIDSNKKILQMRHANQRHATYQNAMRVSQDFVDSTQALVLRMNLLKHDFGVHLVRQKKA